MGTKKPNDSRRLGRALATTPEPSGAAAPISRSVVVSNPEGLHLRPASAVAGAARKFAARVTLILGHQRVDARNVMDLLTLGAGHGAELTVEADGPDAAAALEALSGLLAAAAPPG